MNQQFTIRCLNPLIKLTKKKSRSVDKLENVDPFELIIDQKCLSPPHFCSFHKIPSKKPLQALSSREPVVSRKSSSKGQGEIFKMGTGQEVNAFKKSSFLNNKVKFQSKSIFLNSDRRSTHPFVYYHSSNKQKVSSKEPTFYIPRLQFPKNSKYNLAKSSDQLKIEGIPRIQFAYKSHQLSKNKTKSWQKKPVFKSPKKSILNNDQKENFLSIPAIYQLQIQSSNNIARSKSKNTKIPAFIKAKNKQRDQVAQKINSNRQIAPKISSRQQLSAREQKNQTNISLSMQNYLTTRKLSIEDFIIIKLMGSGTFSDAYIAVERHIGFICALKILQKSKIKEHQSQNDLLRQIKIQFFLSHRHLTNLYGLFEDEGHVYLIMELLPGGNLKQNIKKKSLSEAKAAQIIFQVCSGIKFMHRASIIHRDIKPQNIFINDDYVKIGDFGCSVYFKGKRSSFVGSPCYMSPEQLKREEYDQKIDVWEIGTILYELLFKVCPFERDIKEMAQGKRDSKQLSELTFPNYYQISDQAKDFITRTLQKCSQTRMTIKQALKHEFLKHVLQQYETSSLK